MGSMRKSGHIRPDTEMFAWKDELMPVPVILALPYQTGRKLVRYKRMLRNLNHALSRLRRYH
jgi:hypothetical protein